MVKDLLKRGIGTLVVESPYYGARRPHGQQASKLLHVADLVKLGAMTILESLWLVHMLRSAGIKKVRVSVMMLVRWPNCAMARL